MRHLVFISALDDLGEVPASTIQCSPGHDHSLDRPIRKSDLRMYANPAEEIQGISVSAWLAIGLQISQHPAPTTAKVFSLTPSHTLGCGSSGSSSANSARISFCGQVVQLAGDNRGVSLGTELGNQESGWESARLVLGSSEESPRLAPGLTWSFTGRCRSSPVRGWCFLLRGDADFGAYGGNSEPE